MKVKICGIRSVADALAAAEAGADMIGLNFYPGSPRQVTPRQAAEIVAALPAGVEPVGLFVNMGGAEIRERCKAAGLRTVQLHGDEPPELLAELAEFRLIRAYRCGPAGLEPLADYLQRCVICGRLPDVNLIDAYEAGHYGGTGRRPPWKTIARTYDRERWPALLLAGGLTPENVAAAVSQVRPWGVDVSSGVEIEPGQKDAARIRCFVTAARGSSQESRSRKTAKTE